MGAPSSVAELVARFDRNRETYRSAAYNETQVRREFIDPLFLALGWDIDNRAGYAEAYKDVIHEDAIKIGGATKAPDYCFRIGGRRVFFLEAKKPSVNVREDISPAYQLRRYAWSAKLPLSILTDFEELAVYDCRIKPAPGDKASTGRIQFYKYTEYDERWDELAAIFSRDAVLKGSFDKYAETTRLKRGTAEVDAAFLHEIESWRETLARNFALRNPELETRELNFAVQRTIDRLIFLRMCEDRGVELYQQLQSIANGESCYRRLCELFRLADERYNSGLFHFEPEKGRAEPPDELTTRLALDDKPLKDIIRGLYYPESPYEFSVLPAEILGQVYEQFLGKVIRLTAGHRAVVEDKPEVKKAGGVYYTPAYIVDYIVRQTVGKLVDGRTPKQVSKLRVLDPACGSGSFLVGAYHFLLDWHRDQYVAAGTDKHTKEIYQGPGGQWHLTTSEKKRILLNNIYGVDIDAQAVEVTKLSLLLKVLEGENRQSLERQLRFLHERALPDLGSNIKCGNSLIGPDFYNDRQMSLLDEDEQYRINAFDWKFEFPEVFKGKDSGFDAVIGNPPYLFITEVPEKFRRYYEETYSGVSYRFDLYGAFIESAAVSWVRPDGLFGFIIPHTLLSNDSFQKLRGILATQTQIYHIVDFGPGVFENAKNETMLLFFRRGAASMKSQVEIVRAKPRHFPRESQRFTAPQSDWAKPSGEPWLVHVSPGLSNLLDRVGQFPTSLGELCTINQGLRTGDNERFLATERKGDMWKPAVGGKHVGRYSPLIVENYVCYDPPRLDAPRRREIFTSKEKLVVQEIRNISLPRRIVATLDANQFFCLQSTNVINLRPSCGFALRYLLGVLNSNFVNFYFRCRFPGNNHIPSNQLAGIPIPDASEQQQGAMSKMVDNMLRLHGRLNQRSEPGAVIRTGRQISTLERQIDQLVYELYGLTDEEIALVEGVDERAAAAEDAQDDSKSND